MPRPRSIFRCHELSQWATVHIDQSPGRPGLTHSIRCRAGSQPTNQLAGKTYTTAQARWRGGGGAGWSRAWTVQPRPLSSMQSTASSPDLRPRPRQGSEPGWDFAELRGAVGWPPTRWVFPDRSWEGRTPGTPQRSEEQDVTRNESSRSVNHQRYFCSPRLLLKSPPCLTSQ